MSENKDRIFREKSLERINSPEALDKYIKSTKPSTWFLLLAIIVFLCGTLTWATFGKVESKTTVGAEVTGGSGVCLVKEEDYKRIEKDSFVVIDEVEGIITAVDGPFEMDNTVDSYLSHISGIEEDGWYYLVRFTAGSPNGKYEARLVFERLNPISFVIK